MQGPGAHSWALGREWQLTCKYNITENLLLKSLSVDNKFLNLFKYK